MKKLTAIEEKMPAFLVHMKADNPLFKEASAVFEIINPDYARVIREREEKKLEERRAEELANDLETFKTIKDNFEAVNKSYTGHENSEEYKHMTEALDKAAQSKTWQELQENKKNLADMTKDYLDHTGLGKASIFHRNAETRRKLAFYTLYKSSSNERPYFESYRDMANQVRSRSHRIESYELKDTPGIGKPLAGRVKEINADALANKVGANQPQREHHQRKVQIQAGAVNDKVIEGPGLGQNNK